MDAETARKLREAALEKIKKKAEKRKQKAGASTQSASEEGSAAPKRQKTGGTSDSVSTEVAPPVKIAPVQPEMDPVERAEEVVMSESRPAPLALETEAATIPQGQLKLKGKAVAAEEPTPYSVEEGVLPPPPPQGITIPVGPLDSIERVKEVVPKYVKNMFTPFDVTRIRSLIEEAGSPYLFMQYLSLEMALAAKNAEEEQGGLSGDLAALKGEVASSGEELKKSVAEVEAKTSELEKSLTEVEGKASESRDYLLNRIASLESDLLDVRNELGVAQSELSATRANLGGYHLKITGAEKKIQELRLQSVKEMGAREALDRGYSALKREMTVLKALLVEVGSKVGEAGEKAVAAYKASPEFKDEVVQAALPAYMEAMQTYRRTLVSQYPDFDTERLDELLPASLPPEEDSDEDVFGDPEEGLQREQGQKQGMRTRDLALSEAGPSVSSEPSQDVVVPSAEDVAGDVVVEPQEVPSQENED